MEQEKYIFYGEFVPDSESASGDRFDIYAGGEVNVSGKNFRGILLEIREEFSTVYPEETWNISVSIKCSRIICGFPQWIITVENSADFGVYQEWEKRVWTLDENMGILTPIGHVQYTES